MSHRCFQGYTWTGQGWRSCHDCGKTRKYLRQCFGEYFDEPRPNEMHKHYLVLESADLFSRPAIKRYMMIYAREVGNDTPDGKAIRKAIEEAQDVL